MIYFEIAEGGDLLVGADLDLLETPSTYVLGR
jgi:hypothetical protein